MVDPDDAARFEERLRVLEDGVLLDHAHTENLIERVYELEQTVTAVVARLKAVERATPLRGPRKAPPKRQ
jgi:hypothetical protein